jgi:hypothetical protein
LKHFGICLTQTDLRHISITKAKKLVEHLSLEEQITAISVKASKSGNSSNTAIKHYIENTDNLNVSLQHTKSINILHNGEQIHSFKLQEVIYAMSMLKHFEAIKTFMKN